MARPKRDRHRQIYEIIAAHPEGLTISQIAACAGLTHAQVFAVLPSFDRSGLHLTEDNHRRLYAFRPEEVLNDVR